MAANMRHRGKYMFWALVAFNAFLFITFLYVPQGASREFSQEVNECLRECLAEPDFFQDELNANQITESQALRENEIPTEAQTETEGVKFLNKSRENEISTKYLQNETERDLIIDLPKQEKNDPWRECPQPGRGRNSTFLSCMVDGRLGNVVWNYLTLWASAKRNYVRPILNKSSMDYLFKIFNQSAMTIPSVEEMDEKCNMGGYFTRLYHNGSLVLGSRKDLFKFLENPPMHGYQMLKYGWYVVSSEDTVTYWNGLKSDLVLRDEFTSEAQKELQRFRRFQREMLAANKINAQDHSFEFVGVHVRRTDYMNHMSIVYPGSTSAEPQFYKAAMDWMMKTIQKRLIFVVVSDDGLWARVNLVNIRSDAYLGGNGDIDNPGLDLALLGACNHTIFAYGTFGLTGALLASQPGGYTVIFDPLNGTITKEMEFGANLPGWRIMDNDGNFNFEDKPISYAYHLQPKMTN